MKKLMVSTGNIAIMNTKGMQTNTPVVEYFEGDDLHVEVASWAREVGADSPDTGPFLEISNGKKILAVFQKWNYWKEMDGA